MPDYDPIFRDMIQNINQRSKIVFFYEKVSFKVFDLKNYCLSAFVGVQNQNTLSCCHDENYVSPYLQKIMSKLELQFLKYFLLFISNRV